jgi:hypothetical protein
VSIQYKDDVVYTMMNNLNRIEHASDRETKTTPPASVTLRVLSRDCTSIPMPPDITRQSFGDYLRAEEHHPSCLMFCYLDEAESVVAQKAIARFLSHLRPASLPRILLECGLRAYNDVNLNGHHITLHGQRELVCVLKDIGQPTLDLVRQGLQSRYGRPGYQREILDEGTTLVWYLSLLGSHVGYIRRGTSGD